MSEIVPLAFLWMPGQGPDPIALDRMAGAFSKPRKPMGKAWFLAKEREMYPRLLGDLNTLSDLEIETALEQIATGPGCFGPHDEWTEWYHYLLPRLIERDWHQFWYSHHPVELLMTAFMAQHPDSNGSLPYPSWRDDTLITLGHYIMSGRFWPNGELLVERCLNKRKAPSGIFGWWKADGLLSASLFFCVKYLPQKVVARWFESVISIPNRYWQAQVLVWLVGAHAILTDEICQPAAFPEHGPCCCPLKA